MRNLAKDEIEMAARREAMLEQGFRLFSERGIVAVPMVDVAKAGGIGIATLYRYYNTKMALALDIAAHRWRSYGEEVRALRRHLNVEDMTAAEEMAYYLNCYIDLYRDHRDLLCFHRSLSSYVLSEGATTEQMRPYLDAVGVFAQMFHGMYEKGRRDGTIRTELSEEKMFAATSHIMMAVAVRFAQGLVFPNENEADRTEELALLRDMILKTFVV